MNFPSRLKVMSYNVRGLKPRNYDYLQYIFDKTDILLIQESWLYDYEHSNVCKILPDSCSLGVSSMNSNKIASAGRPFGGLMILYKRSLALPISQINTNSTRICAATIVKDSCKILLMSIYMPCDDNTNDSASQYLDVLSEITAILNIYDDFYVIIGGDFNTDYSRNNFNSRTLKDYLISESLLDAGDVLNDSNYTYESYNGVKSIIDHFILTENCIANVIDYDVLHDGFNLSDHSPIMITLDTQFRLLNNSDNNDDLQDNNIVLDWDNATDDDIMNYKNYLNEFLNFINIPDEITHCVNFRCNQHGINVINNYLEIVINAMILSANMSIPVKSSNNNPHKPKLPGWNTYVKQKKESAILWHRIWKESGCPTDGHLFHIRRFTRKQYHDAILFIKRNSDNIIRHKIAETLTKKSVKEFWKEIKRIKNTVDNKPSIIDNVVGSSNISEVFKDKYNTLYNEFEKTYIGDNILNDLISSKCETNNCSYSHDVDLEQVNRAVKKLKCNKTDPVYGLSSCSILNGTNLLFNALAKIFNILFRHGLSNVNFNKSILIPIPKDKRKSICDSSNYRAIAISSMISKLFEYIILEKIQNNVKLNINQFGYKSNMSTVTCSFILNQTIQYYKNNGSNVYCLFLDASKAFDRVCHKKLFKCLIDHDICPLIIRIIAKMYELSTMAVKWNKSISDFFQISNGVRQGAILSPFLFSLYLDPLLNIINSSKKGCYIGNKPSNIFAYADDIVILAPSVDSLKFLINIVMNYSNDFKLNFNANKSFIIFYSSHSSHTTKDIFMGNQKIEIIKEGKHLGFNMNNSLNIYNFKNIIDDMNTKTNVLRSNFYSLNVQSKIKLFISHCMCLYGCELWNLDDKNIDKLEINWKKCIKSFLCLPMRTRSKLLPLIMKCENLRTIIFKRQLNFYIKGLAHNSSTVRFYFENSVLSSFSFASKNINKIINKFKIPYLSLFLKNRIELSSCESTESWRVNIIFELYHFIENRCFDFFYL